MRKLDKSEYTKVLTLDEALKENGYYAKVSPEMEATAMCIFMIKDGKLYDDISLDCEFGAWDNEGLKGFIESGDNLAKLTKDYSETFEHYKDQIA